MVKSAIYAGAAVVALLGSVAAEARENRPLKCYTGRAHDAPSFGGPALVANVPRSMTPIDLNAVQMTDRRLWKSVIVEGLFARRTETNTLEVTARFVNCTKEPIVTEARTDFMDAQQVPTEKESAWQRIFLSPLSTKTYQTQSIGTTNVANFLVELRSNQ